MKSTIVSAVLAGVLILSVGDVVADGEKRNWNAQEWDVGERPSAKGEVVAPDRRLPPILPGQIVERSDGKRLKVITTAGGVSSTVTPQAPGQGNAVAPQAPQAGNGTTLNELPVPVIIDRDRR